MQLELVPRLVAAAPLCSCVNREALPDGWQELVTEVGFCDGCGEVVWIRLGGFDETESFTGREAP